MSHGSYRPLQPRVTACRECRAPIFFVKPLGTDRFLPVDANPAPTGTVVRLGEYRDAQLLTEVEAGQHQGPKYLDHRTQCPAWRGWRRKNHVPEPAPAEPAATAGAH